MSQLYDTKTLKIKFLRRLSAWKKKALQIKLKCMENAIELVGHKIKEIRKRKNISQEKLAKMIDMNHRSIVRLENSYSKPSLETLNKIAKALNVKITDFFETETIKSRTEIIKDIQNSIDSMNDNELKMFYKAAYYFIH